MPHPQVNPVGSQVVNQLASLLGSLRESPQDSQLVSLLGNLRVSQVDSLLASLLGNLRDSHLVNPLLMQVFMVGAVLCLSMKLIAQSTALLLFTQKTRFTCLTQHQILVLTTCSDI
jgi:hypothetical protein